MREIHLLERNFYRYSINVNFSLINIIIELNKIMILMIKININITEINEFVFYWLKLIIKKKLNKSAAI